MNWTIPKPSEITESSLRKWATEQMEQGIPRQIICDYLLSAPESDDLEVRLDLESELSGVMVDRNMEGKTLEKAGEIDKAIELYEANVADWFIGTHPYDRLRMIYSRQQRYSEAIRVCKSFVKILDAYIKKDSQRGPLENTRDEFTDWIKKLEKKNQGK